MEIQLPPDIQRLVSEYRSLRRWDRAELGRALRRLGLTYGEIIEVIPVPKGTLAGWCRDIRLTEQQIAAIRVRRGLESRRGIPVDTQWRRREEIQRIKDAARLELPDLATDSEWVAGVFLYWAEGAKSEPKLAMANSDPALLRYFMSWVRRFHDPHAGFSLHIILHADNDEPAARKWWAMQLDQPLDVFGKTYIKPDGTGHRKNHLPYGVCTVKQRRSADAFHRTMAWIDAFRATAVWK